MKMIMEKYNDKEKNMQSKAMTKTDGLLASEDRLKSDAFDLEQMREQLGILKQKLDKQTIVTDRLIHQAISSWSYSPDVASVLTFLSIE